MRFIVLVLCVLFCFTSCKSTKRNTVITKKEQSDSSPITITSISKASKIISHANSFKGVRYQYGGTTQRGMDCSGLIYTSFKYESVLLPRISRDMAKKGKRIKLNEVRQGDLLFFKTNKRQAKINHVGLIVNTSKGNIEFIHSTTSKGVITSFLKESYWNKAFVEARRVL